MALARWKRPIAMAVGVGSVAAALTIWFVTPPATQSPRQELDSVQKRSLHRKVYKEYANRPPLGIWGEGVTITPPIPFKPPGGVPVQSFLASLGCSSDAIIVGTVGRAVSDFTEEATFVFTDYDVQLDEVIKDNRHSLSDGETITVARAGGRAESAGRTASAEDQSFLPLSIGLRYLSMLTYLPTSDSYKTTLSQGTYLLQHEGGVRPMTGDGVAVPEITQGSAEFLIESLRTALATCK